MEKEKIEYTLEKIQEVGMMMVASVGGAKSQYMEALKAAKAGKFDEAEKMIEEADKLQIEAHKQHSELVYAEANGNQLPFSLILMHAEDQLLNTETIKILVEELIEIYKNK